MTTTSKYHVTKEAQQVELNHIEAAKKDPSKFEFLYNKYHEQIFRYIYQRVATKEQAFDATQEVFMKAMMNLHKYQYKGVPFSSWLYRIAMSEMGNVHKSKKANRAVNIDVVHVQDMMDEMEDDSLQEREENKAKLIEAIGELPEAELQLIEMRFFEKRPFKEIGEILEITENNAKVKLYRALDKLKKVAKA